MGFQIEIASFIAVAIWLLHASPHSAVQYFALKIETDFGQSGMQLKSPHVVKFASLINVVCREDCSEQIYKHAHGENFSSKTHIKIRLKTRHKRLANFPALPIPKTCMCAICAHRVTHRGSLWNKRIQSSFTRSRYFLPLGWFSSTYY